MNKLRKYECGWGEPIGMYFGETPEEAEKECRRDLINNYDVLTTIPIKVRMQPMIVRLAHETRD